MPTILVLLGWRFFFYANEGDEPIHVHCRKGGVECKYWLDVDNFDIQEAYSYEMSARDKSNRSHPLKKSGHRVDLYGIVAAL